MSVWFGPIYGQRSKTEKQIRCEILSGIKRKRRKKLTMSIAKSGAWPVIPNTVVFKYFSCPAKSMNVITYKKKQKETQNVI